MNTEERNIYIITCITTASTYIANVLLGHIRKKTSQQKIIAKLPQQNMTENRNIWQKLLNVPGSITDGN